MKVVETIKEMIKVSTETGARKAEMAEEAIVVDLTQKIDYMMNQGPSLSMAT